MEQAEAPFQWHRRRNTFSGSWKRDMDLGMASEGVSFFFFCGPSDARCSFFIFLWTSEGMASEGARLSLLLVA